MCMHTGENPYKCETCDAQFAVSGTLKIPIRTHTGENHYLKGHCIEFGVNRLGDSGVKVVLIDAAILQLLLSRRVSYC